MGFGFVTTDVQAAKRLAYWHDLIAPTCGDVWCHPTKMEDFQGQIFINDLGPARLTAVRSSAATYCHEPHSRNATGREHYLLHLALGGPTIFERNGQSIAVKRGDIIVLGTSDRYGMKFAGPAHYVECRLPIEAIAELVPDPEKYTWCVLDGLKGLNSVLRAVLCETAALEVINVTEQAHIYRTIIDMTATCLRQHSGDPVTLCDDRLDRAKRHMLKHLRDPSLNAQRVADAVGLSIRTLYRLFADESTTFMRWLMIQRIEESYRALADGLCRDVTDAALSHGFKDLSHFSRSFTKRFRRSPRSVFRSQSMRTDAYTLAFVRNSRAIIR